MQIVFFMYNFIPKNWLNTENWTQLTQACRNTQNAHMHIP